MEFTLTEAEVARFRSWRKKFDDYPQGVSGGVFSFIFIPTSIGTITIIRHVSGEELDLTDYDSW